MSEFQVFILFYRLSTEHLPDPESQPDDVNVGLLAGDLGPVIGLQKERLGRDPDPLIVDMFVEELLGLEFLATFLAVVLGHGDEMIRI